MSFFSYIMPLAFLLFSQGCGTAPLQESPKMQSVKIRDGSTILKRIGLVLPPSARFEYAEQTSGMDDSARLLLVMSETDWQHFYTQIVKGAPQDLVLSENDNFLLGTGKPGWNPTGTAGLKTGQVLRADATEGLNVGVAPAPNGEIRLFLFWHQT